MHRFSRLLAAAVTACLMASFAEAGWMDPSLMAMDPSQYVSGDYANYNFTAGVPITLDATGGAIQAVYLAAPTNGVQPYVAGGDSSAQYAVYLDESTGGASLYLNRNGLYAAEIWRNGAAEPERVIYVDGHFLGKGKLTGPANMVAPPATQVTIAAIDDSAIDTLAAYYVQQGETVQRCSTIEAIAAAIDSAYQANNNRPVSVTLGGHGGDPCPPGAFYFNGTDALSDNNPAVQELITRCRGKISDLVFASCLLGRDEVWLRDLGRRLNCRRVSAFDNYLLVTPARFFWSSFLYCETAGSFRTFTTPEPATLLLLLIGAMAVIPRYRGRSRTRATSWL